MPWSKLEPDVSSVCRIVVPIDSANVTDRGGGGQIRPSPWRKPSE
jgi:hypothetical protein